MVLRNREAMESLNFVSNKYASTKIGPVLQNFGRTQLNPGL